MTSVSTSTSFIPQYSEEPFLQQIAQYAQSLAGNMYSWAQNAYQHTSQLTDQVVGNFLASSEMSRGLAQNALDRYQNVFQPQENALIRDANTYASPERIRSEMGMAQAGVEHAGEAGRQNALRDLASYGIDPSSGRYASLDRAERAMTAAAAAGAGNQARRATEQTGRALRSEAIQVGERYPGIAMGAINTGLQALTGAQNASLSNANTGRNLMSLPNDYLRTASELKYPPLGNRSSQSNMEGGGGSGGGGSGGGGRSGGGEGGGGGGPRGSAGGDQSWAMNHPQPVQRGGSDEERGGRNNNRQQQQSSGYRGGNDFGNPGAQFTRIGNPTEQGEEYGPFADRSQFEQQWPDFSTTEEGNFGSDQFSQANLGSQDAQEGWNGNASSGWDGTYDQGANEDYGFDYGSQQDNDTYSTAALGQSWGNDESTGSIGAFGGEDENGWDDWWRRNGNYSSDYVRGGTATPGGRVPEQMSDSGGLAVDDVPANLTAGEFVIPRDVAAWKGQEFFQKLIDQSRQGSSKATAKGEPSKGPARPARFNSRPGLAA